MAEKKEPAKKTSAKKTPKDTVEVAIEKDRLACLKAMEKKDK